MLIKAPPASRGNNYADKISPASRWSNNVDKSSPAKRGSKNAEKTFSRFSDLLVHWFTGSAFENDRFSNSCRVRGIDFSSDYDPTDAKEI